MTNQTTNNKGNGFQSIPKKWWLIGLCSFSILGGLVTYGYQSANQPEKSVAKSETVSSRPKKSSLWEEQIKEEGKKEKSSENNEKSTVDKILGVLTGDKEDSQTIFGIKVADNNKKDRTNLIGELAKALDVQEAKEQKRESIPNSENKKESLFLLTDKQQSSKEEMIDLSKPILSNKKPEVILPEKPENSGTDEEKPVVPDIPVLPDNPNVPVIPDIPDIPVDPTPEPTPDPEPVPPVTPDEPDHTLDQLITTNKLALTTVKNKAEQLNQSLNRVKKELENLTMIEEKTAQTAEQATNEWQKVSDLVDEYNRLSQEIKKLIEVDGQVLPINYDLYRETYEQLTQKVTEIKEAQKQANQTTTQMSESVQQAQETANRLPEMNQQYQDLQTQVSTTKDEIQATVSNAQLNEQVGKAVQNEITQATQAAETLATTNQVVGSQIEESQQIDYQPALEQASQTVETITNEARQQNSAVDSVLNDFQSLPTVEEVETPSTPETAPETPEMTDSSLNKQNQSESSINIDTSDQSSTLSEVSSSDSGTQIGNGEIV
ncbi:hypothetical protein [Enterococcus hirae]|uniref:hypothetical protein n=1 Tax=Enterococcus hirae TaxID=1354 RepID=UPI001A96939E|nr:hypothetical protein [Enterococcus hirae]MBO1116977.1 hypothetical protein [Enterococcus hirae]